MSFEDIKKLDDTYAAGEVNIGFASRVIADCTY